jgi:hypothetical protein
VLLLLCPIQVRKVSPLWIAAQHNFQHIYSFLLNRGANVDSLLQSRSDAAGIQTAQRVLQQHGLSTFPAQSSVVSFVKLLMAQMSVTTVANTATAAVTMTDGGLFASEADLFHSVSAHIPLAQVQKINATPYTLRREVLAWAQVLFWKLFPQGQPGGDVTSSTTTISTTSSSMERHDATHRSLLRRYIEFMCLFLDIDMIQNVICLRLTCRLSLKFRQFPVPHSANQIVELNLIESFLGFDVAEHISTGILTAAVLKIKTLATI